MNQVVGWFLAECNRLFLFSPSTSYVPCLFTLRKHPYAIRLFVICFVFPFPIHILWFPDRRWFFLFVVLVPR